MGRRVFCFSFGAVGKKFGKAIQRLSVAKKVQRGFRINREKQDKEFYFVVDARGHWRRRRRVSVAELTWFAVKGEDG